MKTNKQSIAMIAALATLFALPMAYADNITISDNNTGSIVGGHLYTETGPGWYQGAAGGVTGAISEYHEVEPGMQTGSAWDLQAFVTPQAGELGVISGYDIKNGYAGTTIGDIFVNVTGPVYSYPDPNTPYTKFNSNSLYGYDFAIHLDAAAGTYSVYQLDANTVIENGEYNSAGNYNAASQPWRVATASDAAAQGGDSGTFLTSGTLSYTSINASAAAGLLGFSADASGHALDASSHYAVITNMGWIQPFLPTVGTPSVTYKLTMSCGNDNMLGVQHTGFQRVPDNAATLALLGIGLLSLAGFAKWRKKGLAS